MRYGNCGKVVNTHFMTQRNDIYNNGARVDRLPSEDPTTGDINDSEGPRNPREDEDPDDDDENITGDEDLYDTIEGEEPADEEDVIDEQEDEELDMNDINAEDLEEDEE